MTTQLIHTRNSLPEAKRIEIVTVLQARLADSIDLMMQAKQAHWNVKGLHFFPLHELFDKVHAETASYVDIIAERIVQLGGMAQGTIRAVAKASELPEYSLDILSGPKHVAELAHSIAYFGEKMREAIELFTKHEDAISADICTQIYRGVDMNLWFVEAHEQGEH